MGEVGCKTAGIGCIECKSAMADNLIKWIAPIRARRLEFAAQPARVLEMIDAGSDRARETAQATMKRVREAVFGWKAKRESISGAANEEAAGSGGLIYGTDSASHCRLQSKCSRPMTGRWTCCWI